MTKEKVFEVVVDNKPNTQLEFKTTQKRFSYSDNKKNNTTAILF